MIARRSFSTVSRVLFASSKAGGGSKKAASKEASKKQESSSAPAAESFSETAQRAAPEPFKNDAYSAPEYFGHNKWSYADVMVSLAGQRLPQKSNKVPS